MPSPQDGFKTGLFEVPVARQRLTDAFILHDDECDAVGKRPVLVGAGLVECQSSIEVIGAGAYNPNARVASELANEPTGQTSTSRSRHRVRELREHPFAGKDGPTHSLGRDHSPLVMLIRSIKEGDEIEGVREDRFQGLGRP